jgi:MSHA biogenesis protein MshJ
MSKAVGMSIGRLAARFDAMSRRERALVAFAALAGIVLVGKSLLIDPPLARAATAERLAQQQRAEAPTIEAALQSLRARLAADPDAANKARLSLLQAEMGTLDAALKEIEGRLVPPERMNALLERMLAQHSGLRLVSLKSLAPVNLAEAPPPAVAPGVAATGRGTEREWGLYRHGVELRLEGGYAELHAWLAQMESSPQRLLWGELRFEVVEHPRSLLTVTVFTLSTDKAWLAI